MAQTQTWGFTAVSSPTVCDWDTVPLGCATGSVLNVHGAFYGRGDTHTCYDQAMARGFAPELLAFTECWLPEALGAVQRECEGKTGCELSHNILPDPCYGVYKYLQVDYRCVKPGGSNARWLPPLVHG
jgi:hypothetical protein